MLRLFETAECKDTFAQAKKYYQKAFAYTNWVLHIKRVRGLFAFDASCEPHPQIMMRCDGGKYPYTSSAKGFLKDDLKGEFELLLKSRKQRTSSTTPTVHVCTFCKANGFSDFNHRRRNCKKKKSASEAQKKKEKEFKEKQAKA